MDAEVVDARARLDEATALLQARECVTNDVYFRLEDISMAEPLHRTQILLRKDQHVTLRDLASREGTSLSELIRTLVDDGLERRHNEAQARIERRLRALGRIEEHARAAQERRGGRPLEINPAEVIRQLREERDDELIRRLTPVGDRR